MDRATGLLAQTDREAAIQPGKRRPYIGFVTCPAKRAVVQ
jgi:hypothetical protein